MSSPFSPQHLDLKAFATSQSALSGEVDLHSMPRLRADCAEEVAGKAEWSAQGELRQASDGQAAVWMHLQAKTEVPLTCQRCLKTVEQALEIDRSFRFVKDEATAEAQDDESDEDLLVLSKDFDLLALVEDELLMALPLVPMHTSCQSEHAPTSKEDSGAEADTKPNPFAVLATMRLSKN
jgi:uncharacterized protein